MEAAAKWTLVGDEAAPVLPPGGGSAAGEAQELAGLGEPELESQEVSEDEKETKKSEGEEEGQGAGAAAALPASPAAARAGAGEIQRITTGPLLSKRPYKRDAPAAARRRAAAAGCPTTTGGSGGERARLAPALALALAAVSLLWARSLASDTHKPTPACPATCAVAAPPAPPLRDARNESCALPPSSGGGGPVAESGGARCGAGGLDARLAALEAGAERAARRLADAEARLAALEAGAFAARAAAGVGARRVASQLEGLRAALNSVTALAVVEEEVPAAPTAGRAACACDGAGAFRCGGVETACAAGADGVFACGAA